MREPYKPPYLFQQYETLTTERQRRIYVEDELVKMADAGKLCLTDLYNQRGNIPDLCGSIILGHDVDGGDMIASDVPDELAQYQVKLKSCGNDRRGNPFKIAYKLPWRPTEDRMIKSFGVSGSSTYAGGSAPGLAMRTYEPKIVNTGKTEARLSAKNAWYCLRQYGKYCVTATRAALQASKWLVEEVEPGETAPKKRGPGRPKKQAPEVVDAAA